MVAGVMISLCSCLLFLSKNEYYSVCPRAPQLRKNKGAPLKIIWWITKGTSTQRCFALLITWIFENFIVRPFYLFYFFNCIRAACSDVSLLPHYNKLYNKLGNQPKTQLPGSELPNSRQGFLFFTCGANYVPLDESKNDR